MQNVFSCVENHACPHPLCPLRLCPYSRSFSLPPHFLICWLIVAVTWSHPPSPVSNWSNVLWISHIFYLCLMHERSGKNKKNMVGPRVKHKSCTYLNVTDLGFFELLNPMLTFFVLSFSLWTESTPVVSNSTPVTAVVSFRCSPAIPWHSLQQGEPSWKRGYCSANFIKLYVNFNRNV